MYQPLAFIIIVSAIRALSEDIAKHRADDKRNSYPYDILVGDQWKPVKSGDIAVGNIIRVKQNEMIPADMLFLGSSNPKGHCFIDKANLNGETKLEVYTSIRPTRSYCQILPDDVRGDEAIALLNDTTKPVPLADLELSLSYEPPNKKFDSFRGCLTMKDSEGDEADFPIDGKSLLMRETNLKNTHYIYGLVVYTGNDTKIQRSNLEGEKRSVKVSRVMRDVNSLLKYMFVVQFILCLVGGILAASWAYRHSADWYLMYDESVMSIGDAVVTAILAIFTWFINLSQIVPISLIVSSEMVKFAMALLINQDITMYHDPIKKKSRCNTSTIHEDLGLIDYIFSDKTGTLTQNKMEFRYALLPSGFEFGSRVTEIARAVMQRNEELNDRKNGTYIPKPLKRWTQIVKPYVLPRDIDTETGHDQECCQRFCPTFLHGCWINPKPRLDSIHANYPQPFDTRKNDDSQNLINSPKLPASSSTGASDINSSNEIPANLNVFSEAERRILLNSLYGPCPEGMSTEMHQEVRVSLHNYMLNMALSNTVKPYYDSEGLQFQPESAEELAMALFSQKCGYTRLPEKDEKDKTPEEKLSNANVRIQIQKYNPDLTISDEVEEIRFALLGVLGFTSARARVSIIYQEEVTGDIHVMIKGQDTTVLPFVKLPAGNKYEEDLLASLKGMGNNGLRTLVAGYSVKDYAWWSDIWGPKYIAVRDSTVSNDDLKREMEHTLYEQIEQDADFLYVGCIGMEDQLQPLVPETIQACLASGVKVWMITGDKLDTAKNIALACNLIDADMQPQIEAGLRIHDAMSTFADSRLINITGEWNTLFENREELAAIFDALDYDHDGRLMINEVSMLLSSLNAGIAESSISNATRKFFPQDSPDRGLTLTGFLKLMAEFKRTLYDAVLYDVEEGIARYNRIEDHDAYPISLLVNRDAFSVMFPGKLAQGQQPDPDAPTEEQLDNLRDRFFYLASLAKSVVFARAQPAMKKKMVTEIQKRIPSALTLAIGDGANDTDMITAAHVGVGIAGVEGTAATNSSDYALGTFRMLHTLLFVHGFWSYHRISALVCFIFYKAVMLAIIQFIFGFFSGFSGQQFYNDPVYQLYNVFFTSLPIISLAIFDKPLPKNTLEDNPIAFREQKHKAFNPFVFFSWILRSFIHCILLFFIPFLSYGWNDVSTSNGQTDGFTYISLQVFFGIALLPNFLILLSMQSIQFFHVFSIFLSILAIMLIIWGMNIEPFAALNKPLLSLVNRQYSSASFWLVLILSVCAPLILELLFLYIKRQLRPSFTQILQEKVEVARLTEKKLTHDLITSKSRGTKIDLPGIELGCVVVDDNQVKIDRPLITPADESEWSSARGRQFKQVPQRQKAATNAFATATPVDADEESKEERLRSALIRTILRFRNQTGSQFDSAASSQYHNVVSPDSIQRRSSVAPRDPSILTGKKNHPQNAKDPNSHSEYHDLRSPSTLGEVQTVGGSIRGSGSSSVDGIDDVTADVYYPTGHRKPKV